MLEWLKPILGDHYTEDIEKQISAEIGKGFVARADFNAKTDEIKNLQAQLKTAQDGLAAFDGVDVAELKNQIKKLTDDMAAQADGFAFDSALDSAIRDAGGRSTKAIRGMLDLDALKASKDRGADIKAALDTLTKENAWAFTAAQPDTGATVDTGSEHGIGGTTGAADGVEAAFAKLNPGLKL